LSSLADNLVRVEEAIAAACKAAGRARGEVELMAISKTHPTEALVEAEKLGLRLFGESRVQEFAAKSARLAVSSAVGTAATVRSQIHVHMIGNLQSNKAAKAVEVFDGIDSLDSVKLAERLDAAVAGNVVWAGKRLPVLVEIKLSVEESKAGLAPDSAELAELLERLPDLMHLEAQGLMTIAPLDVSEEETRGCFRQLRELRDALAQKHSRLHLPVLSMGMSGDFGLAIAEGATRIRIGTALFGAREYLA